LSGLCFRNNVRVKSESPDFVALAFILSGSNPGIKSEEFAMNPSHQYVIKPLVSEEVYTDRQEYLDYFHRSALKAIDRRARSTVLLGQRRMGKTEIFKRVINRLFFEQDHKDPRAAVPVFFSFPDEDITRREFALRYVENFIRWYAAFRLRDVSVLSDPKYRHELFESLKSRMEISKGFYIAFDLLRAIELDGATLPAQQALYLPREIADFDDSTVVMFLDELQNTDLPEYGFRVVGFMQEAVESPNCPHFVTGSAMSILVQDILGRGALFGRFAHKDIEGLSDYWGAELALRAARYYHVSLPQIMAPVLSDRCGGNPFYIVSVVQQASEQGKPIADEEALSEMLAVDLSSGFIWNELHAQVSRWITKVNKHGITKRILFLAVSEEGERIDLERIREELRKQEGYDADIPTIRNVLVTLSRGDLIDYKSFGDWFGKIKDPILEDFLKVWGRAEVAGENHREVEEETVTRYKKLKKRVSEYKGYLAEVFMVQILWNAQGKTLPGRFFHSPEDVRMPDRFIYVDQRSRLGAGKGLEIDVFATAGTEVWIAQSKWRKEPVGRPEAEHLLGQAEIVRERKGDDLDILRIWLFAGNGVTIPAEKLMRENGVLWSDRADLDALLEMLGLRTLPVLDKE
jgi:hypothetical protein